MSQKLARYPDRDVLEAIEYEAEKLAQTTFIPDRYQDKPNEIIAVCLRARELGIPHQTALEEIYSVHGNTCCGAELMVALVRQANAGHSIQPVEGECTQKQATWRGVRGDTGDSATVTFTTQEAAQAGLTSNPTWKQYPGTMCHWRAVSKLCRLLFSDVILGMSHTPDEVGATVKGDPTTGNVEFDVSVDDEDGEDDDNALAEEPDADDEEAVEGEFEPEEANGDDPFAGVDNEGGERMDDELTEEQVIGEAGKQKVYAMNSATRDLGVDSEEVKRVMKARKAEEGDVAKVADFRVKHVRKYADDLAEILARELWGEDATDKSVDREDFEDTCETIGVESAPFMQPHDCRRIAATREAILAEAGLEAPLGENLLD